MAISTYSELLAAITNFIADDLSDERAAECVRLAEGDIDLRLAGMDIRPMESRQTGTVTGEFLAVPELPAAFITTKSFEISWEAGGETYTRRLKAVSPSGIATLAERGVEPSELPYDTTEQPPEYFAHQGTEFRFYPPPLADTYETTYTAQIVCTTRLPRLSESNTSNWLLEAFPNIYLVGALKWAEFYGWNDDRATGMEDKFNNEMVLLAQAYPKPKNETPLRHDLPIGRRAYC